MRSQSRKISWVSAVFLTTTPILAVVAATLYTQRNGIHPMDIALFFVFYILTGLSITAGYHRYYAHRSYDCHPSVQLLYLLFGAAAIENSVLHWARDHRIHHQKVDTDEDPYNILRGIFYAHMGWIFFKDTRDEDFSCAPDLLKDRMVRWQERYYLPLLILVGFGLPTLIGWTVGRPFGGFLWGGLVRAVVVQHMTFCINSLAHYVGKQPYSLDNTARDSWWLALITYGEGYHNFHHRFAADYRNGYRWYQFDPTKWWIMALERLGLVTRVTRYRDELILRARIETDMRKVVERIAHAPEVLSTRLVGRMQSAREQLEGAYAQWQEAKLHYQTIKRSVIAGSEIASREWKRRLQTHNFEFQAAQARWALLIAALSRFPLPGHLS